MLFTEFPRQFVRQVSFFEIEEATKTLIVGTYDFKLNRKETHIISIPNVH